jgi:hypothetical protein
MISSFILFFLVQSPCEFKQKTEDVFELQIEKKNVEISVLENDARLIKCEPVSKFKDTYVAEIDTGTAGTQVKVNETVAYLVKAEGRELKILSQNKIEESESSFNQKTQKLETNHNKWNYRIEKDRKGEPTLMIEKKKQSKYKK